MLDTRLFGRDKQSVGDKLPLNTDNWNGYPLEREKFYEVLAEFQSKPGRLLW